MNTPKKGPKSIEEPRAVKLGTRRLHSPQTFCITAQVGMEGEWNQLQHLLEPNPTCGGLTQTIKRNSKRLTISRDLLQKCWQMRLLPLWCKCSRASSRNFLPAWRKTKPKVEWESCLQTANVSTPGACNASHIAALAFAGAQVGPNLPMALGTRRIMTRKPSKNRVLASSESWALPYNLLLFLS